MAFNIIKRLEEFPRLMSVDDVADALQLSKFTVYRMAQKKQIPSMVIGGTRKFDPSVLVGWLCKKDPGLAVAARQLQERSEA
jgi:excisionase family DNA binding protein